MQRIWMNYERSDRLTNAGELEIIFLGNGGALNQTQYNNNILVIKGQNHILLDCGTTAPTALKKYLNRDMSSIKNVAISHLHADHVGGLECLGWHHYLNKEKPTVWSKVDVWPALKPGMGVLNDKEAKITDYFNVGVLNEGRYIKLGDDPKDSLLIQFYMTQHVPGMASYGFIVDHNYLFTMDSLLESWYVEKAHRWHLIFHDCSSKDVPTHASINELRKLPKEVKEKMYLMHIDPGWYEVTDFRGIVPQGVRMVIA